MPFCTQCAHAIPAEARFCAACGAPVAVAASPAAPSALPADPRLSQAPTRAGDPASSSPPSASGLHGRFEPGTRLGTRYRIVALLGRGGMGEVYRADDLELGQSVALKFLPASVSGNAAELARFRGEVRIARQIAHPNVCRVYDIGEADGHVFLSMEYIDGEDLASVLRRMGRPTPDKAIEIARQIGLGLAAAHEAGMLHRDLKPANVMIDGRGRARITDFGLAGLAVELAQGGQVAGTPAYMAPEQLAGGAVSARSDLYALGLVLYELFTGRRAFPASSLAELRRMQESGSITTPSDFARDLDPAVERVILHCLERDPDLRPPSAYAVLGALPGGDPLAAALAAGETPSPELVANAGDRGTLALPWVGACAALVVAGLATWGGLIGPEYRALKEPVQVLSVRAADLMGRTGAFGALPKHSAEGFAQHRDALKALRAQPARTAPAGDAIYFWRRWSPRLLESPQIHQEIVTVDNQRPTRSGEGIVLLDPEGRLIGLRAIPADTTAPSSAGRADWAAWFAAAGLDPAGFAPVAPPRAAPAACDTVAAWTGALPWRDGERVTVQMGASRGRLVHFTIVSGWGATTAAVDQPGAGGAGPGWFEFLVFGVLTLAASVYFGFRNLQLGRGDWRGATRIAGFVFVMNLLEAVFTTRLAEVGMVAAGWDLVNGRAFGHALMHSVGMWFAYMALEPYVRRLWPRMLVSWTRLVSGRARDPLVGRDLLIGGAAGAAAVGIGVLGEQFAGRLGLGAVPTLVSGRMLESLASLPSAICGLAYAGSVCVLSVLEGLVFLLVLRLVFRRTDVAVILGVIGLAVTGAVEAAATDGWALALFEAALYLVPIVVLMRVGLLAAVVATFVALVMRLGTASFDLSAWYGDRALLAIAMVVAITGYGALTAMGGRSILGDPLRAERAR